ncbi:Uncharacterised protein [Weissella viridescens]|uniref:Uncharacterized protein n=1 Tax=Weissella viridescens TaxID=1629 RepID=A0A380P834_WEIVI|nr:Uncharacterised protein [Weissella viridescens]
MPNYYPSDKQIQNLFAFLNDSKNYLTTSREITHFITQFGQSSDLITACFYAHQESYLDFRAEFPRILYVLSGQVTAWIDSDKQCELEAGHLILPTPIHISNMKATLPIRKSYQFILNVNSSMKKRIILHNQMVKWRIMCLQTLVC